MKRWLFLFLFIGALSLTGLLLSAQPTKAVCCCQNGTLCEDLDSQACVDRQSRDGSWAPTCDACEVINGRKQCPAATTTSVQRVCKYNDILPKCTCDGNCDLDQFVQLFINLYAFGLRLLGPLAAFYLIVGGVILMTASGYQNRIEMGKNIINQAVAGVFIVLVSWIVIDTTVYLLTYDKEGNPHHLVFQKPWAGGFTYNCEGSDTLERGCENKSVQELETNLSKLGYAITPNQLYDQETEEKVRQFQSDNNARLFPNNLATSSCSQVLWVHVVNNGQFDLCTWGEGACLPVTMITGAPPNDYTKYHVGAAGTADAATRSRLNDIAAFQPKEFTKCVTQP